MKILAFITNNPGKYINLEKNIKNEFSNAISIRYVKKDNPVFIDNCLYILEVNSKEDLKIIDNRYSFIVCSSLKTPSIAIQCFRSGVLDCVLAPKNEEQLITKIKRYILDYDSIVNRSELNNETIILSLDELIDIAIKGARRGGYDYSIVAFISNSNIQGEVKKFISNIVRETDTVMSYDDNTIIISMPFCNKKQGGTGIVIEKLAYELKSNFNINTIFSAATLSVDGDTKEELLTSVISKLKNNSDLAKSEIAASL